MKLSSEYTEGRNLNARTFVDSNLYVPMKYLGVNCFWIDDITFARICVIGAQDFLDNRFGRNLNFGRYDTLGKGKGQFCPSKKVSLFQVKELDSKRHTGKHLVGSIKRSISTPASKPLKHGAGYNKSAKFVSNVARVMPRLAGVAHCINSAYRSCCSKALCSSVREIGRVKILSKVNLSWNKSGKMGLILWDSTQESRVLIRRATLPLGHNQTPGHVT